MKKFLFLCCTVFMLVLLSGTTTSAQENLSYEEVINTEVSELNEDLISDDLVPYGLIKKPELAGDMGALASRSTYVGKVSGAKQYHNSGHYNKGLTEMTKLGGRGEVYPVYNNNGTLQWRKDGSDGVAFYYQSSSFTDGLQRWTINFPGYKIRFMDS